MDLKKFTLLVVDDEEALREAIAFDLIRKGFTVLTAADGEEAIAVVKQRKVDLVLSDMRMPGGGGMGLLEKIREHDPKIPVVIFVTGFSDVPEAECIAKGASKVLPKPFERKVMMDSVFEALGLPPPSSAVKKAA